MFAGVESTQHWPLLLQRSFNPQQDLEATEGLHFSLFGQKDYLTDLEAVRKQDLRRIITDPNHGMVWHGKDLADHLVQPPAIGRDTVHCPWTLAGMGSPLFPRLPHCE